MAGAREVIFTYFDGPQNFTKTKFKFSDPTALAIQLVNEASSYKNDQI